MSVKKNWIRSIPSLCNGFTLIEILVTVVVLSIGLLGLAGLQATALRFNSTAYQRSQATILAYDIAEQMRANAKAARCGVYTNGAGRTGENCSVIEVSDLPARQTIATQHIQRWRTTLTNTLPAAVGTIGYAGTIVTITISWDDSRGQNPPQQFVMTTEL